MLEVTPKASQVGYNIAQNARLLRRYAGIERRSMRILSAWLPEIPEWEAKKGVARHLWDEAEHVTWLRQRLRELRGGRPDADTEPGMAMIMEEAIHAPNTAALIAGLYLGVKQNLLTAYKNHNDRTSHVADMPTVDVLRRIIAEEERHLAWAEVIFDDLTRANDALRQTALDWQAYLESLIVGAGGDLAALMLTAQPIPERPAVYTPFKRSLKGQRDDRFDVRPASEVYKTQSDMNSQSFEEYVITGFKIYATEMWAAEVCASCIYDAPADMPWDYYRDIARQCWDEARHAEIGEVRLAEMGISLSDFPTAVSEYERSVRMPVLHRYCDLTIMAEAEHIHVRKPRMDSYTDAGDLRSAEFVDYDWSDEVNHIRYGVRWVNYMLEDDARSLDDLKAEVWALRHQLAASNPNFELPPYFVMDA
jgi:uncharacterized ferritin-like protein (DUF455 family)